MKDINKKTSFFPNHKMLFCQDDVYLEASALVGQELFDLPKAFITETNDNKHPKKSVLLPSQKILLLTLGFTGFLAFLWFFS